MGRRAGGRQTPPPPKGFVDVPFLKEVTKMYMKVNTVYKLVKIKHNTLLLTRFYQVKNIKSVTIFNSIANALGQMDIPLADRKVRCYDGQGL